MDVPVQLQEDFAALDRSRLRHLIDRAQKIYLIGNPLVWWLSTLAVVAYACLPGFFAKFLKLPQRVMWTTNASLTDRHTYDSRPSSWPRLRCGIDNRQIYLIGNPLVWWLSTLAVVAYASVRGFLVLRAQRGHRDFDNTKVVKYDSLCGFLFVGWALHYFPFFLMGRQLFLHHYFPALYFAVLLSCAGFDLATSTLRPRVRLQIAAVLVILAVWHIAHFSPLAYGSPWTKSKCVSAKWFKTWDFSCKDFHNDYSQYNNVGFTPQQSHVPVAHTTVGGAADGRPAIVVPHGNEKEPFDPNALLAQNNKVDPVVKNDGGAEAAAGAGDSETTGVRGEGVPEPGRNVFEGDAGAEVKSKSKGEKDLVPPVEVLPTTVKEISAVAGGAAGGGVVGAVAGGTSAEPKEEEKIKDEEAQTQTQTTDTTETTDATTELSTAATETQTEAESQTQEKKRPVPAGPLGEAEQEAKMAADELFLEARR
ncbi:hypothetical protein D9615_008123 [Tricholomella constricta]|uniref:Dolichyl-phosphate-mannose--protein mannosyltransferase n=1 Tax=Tricholomella constricta TaxID=117010 RepID=A0A8H5GWC7_9AGAR|nr:hypothetical protein D9615_008123 [Tricholomella constricta]